MSIVFEGCAFERCAPARFQLGLSSISLWTWWPCPVCLGRAVVAQQERPRPPPQRPHAWEHAPWDECRSCKDAVAVLRAVVRDAPLGCLPLPRSGEQRGDAGEDAVQAEQQSSREGKKRLAAGRELSARPMILLLSSGTGGEREACESTCIHGRKFDTCSAWTDMSRCFVMGQRYGASHTMNRVSDDCQP